MSEEIELALSDDERNKISQHIESKLAKHKCAVCEDTNWIPPDAIHELRDFNFGHLKTGGIIVPVVVMTCQRCGYIMLFNAIHTGVISAEGGLLLS